MFSKSCKYALRAVVFITQQSELGNRHGVKTIAKSIDSPEAFTGKILQKLAKNKIIHSVKGPYGGFTIEKQEAQNIAIGRVVDVMDGDEVYKGCGLGLRFCDASAPCSLHYKFATIRDNLKQMLEINSIYDLTYSKEKILGTISFKNNTV